jgi:hypothetical protein
MAVRAIIEGTSAVAKYTVQPSSHHSGWKPSLYARSMKAKSVSAEIEMSPRPFQCSPAHVSPHPDDFMPNNSTAPTIIAYSPVKGTTIACAPGSVPIPRTRPV